MPKFSRYSHLCQLGTSALGRYHLQAVDFIPPSLESFKPEGTGGTFQCSSLERESDCPISLGYTEGRAGWSTTRPRSPREHLQGRQHVAEHRPHLLGRHLQGRAHVGYFFPRETRACPCRHLSAILQPALLLLPSAEAPDRFLWCTSASSGKRLHRGVKGHSLDHVHLAPINEALMGLYSGDSVTLDL